MTRLFVIFVISLYYISHADARASITDNGYNDVVIAISPDVEQDPELIDNLKILLTWTSLGLYKVGQNAQKPKWTWYTK